MNVLYLIGNGFDLRLGLPTRYEDFLDYYEKRCSLSDTSEAESITKYKGPFFKNSENNSIQATSSGKT